MSFGVIYVAVILLLMLFALMREMLRPGFVLFT